MIARPKVSRNEWTTAERGAFEVGHVALFSRPVGDARRGLRDVARGAPRDFRGDGRERGAGDARVVGAALRDLAAQRAGRVERARRRRRGRRGVRVVTRTAREEPLREGAVRVAVAAGA